MEENRIQVIQLKFTNEYQKYIQEIFAMIKDQFKKEYDLTAIEDEDNPNKTILDNLEVTIKEGAGFAAIDTKFDTVAGYVELDEARFYGDVMVDVKVHPIFRKAYWGPHTREIARAMVNKLTKCYNINRITCEAPQIAYGCIKLLKDVGFRHEGTLRDSSVYRDKNGNPKYYDTLIYGLLINEEVK